MIICGQLILVSNKRLIPCTSCHPPLGWRRELEGQTWVETCQSPSTGRSMVSQFSKQSLLWRKKKNNNKLPHSFDCWVFSLKIWNMSLVSSCQQSWPNPTFLATPRLLSVESEANKALILCKHCRLQPYRLLLRKWTPSLLGLVCG